MARVTALNVNGTKRTVDVDSSVSLLSVLRDNLDLTGTKYGCGEGRCGACSVLIDGQLTRSCVTPVGRAAASKLPPSKPLQRMESCIRCRKHSLKQMPCNAPT